MVSVCAGLIFKSGKILICRRAPGRRHAGLWEFPGGRIEAGETPAEALKRELREELGVEAEIGEEMTRSRHTYDFGEIELIALIVKKITSEIKLTDHDEIAWIEARRLAEYEMTPADVPIAEVVARHRRRGRYEGTHPKKFAQKYKELRGDPAAMAKAAARGSTPAGAHLPVMLNEVVDALEPLAGAVILDCTLGWGGHAEELARRAGPSGGLIGLDRDGEELARTEKRLASRGVKITACHRNYAAAAAVLSELKIDGVDAVLADFGVSSMQLDRPDRGMSFKTDGPLDMRMDRSSGPSAAQWLIASTEEEIARALTRWGDEPDAEKIARALKDGVAQGRAPQTTFQLSSIVGVAKGLGPGPFKKKDAFAHHPAARTFQALRIAVNDEFAALERFLDDLPKLLRPNGRAALITFHSGEETLVRESIVRQAKEGLWQKVPEPQRPSPEDVRQNPRSRSAKLWPLIRK